MKIPRYILPFIIISQLCCTSLWFAGNGIITDLATHFNLNNEALGYLTSAVQFGFISGTLFFALFTIADRFSPSKVFFISAILGALFNLGLLFDNQQLHTLLLFRFLTGFFLAGIYPVGMKIATDYYNKGLGKSLGFLVGALVLGTALPHLLKDLLIDLSWKSVLISTSSLALFGGSTLFIFVPNGPYRKAGTKLDLKICFTVFKNLNFRKAAFGYFGHMWELYTFWAFVPVLLKVYENLHENISFNISIESFIIIAVGSISCVIGGFLAQNIGSKKVAFYSLLLSCLCCILFPIFVEYGSKNSFILFLIFWGMVVISDSPQFSTLMAQNVSAQEKGTALTIVNCIGFAITIVSILVLNYLFSNTSNKWVFTILAIGPIFGLLSLKLMSKIKEA